MFKTKFGGVKFPTYFPDSFVFTCKFSEKQPHWTSLGGRPHPREILDPPLILQSGQPPGSTKVFLKTSVKQTVKWQFYCSNKHMYLTFLKCFNFRLEVDQQKNSDNLCK